MRLFLINVNDDNKTGVIDLFGDAESDTKIDDAFLTYQKIIGCSYIDITTRLIDGVEYDIICDDNGLSKNLKVSGIDNHMKTSLVGNIIISRCTPDGNQKTLDDDDINRIQDNIGWIIDNGMMHNVILNLSYCN